MAKKKTARLVIKRRGKKVCAYRGKRKLGCAQGPGATARLRKRFSRAGKGKKRTTRRKKSSKRKSKGRKAHRSHKKSKKRKNAKRVEAGKKAWATRKAKTAAEQARSEEVYAAAHPKYVPGEEAVYGLGGYRHRRKGHRKGHRKSTKRSRAAKKGWRRRRARR